MRASTAIPLKLKKTLQSKFAITRKRKPKKPAPDTLEKMHEKWFFNLEPKYFVQLQREYNELKLSIKLPNLTDYDDWLNHFKTMPPNHIRLLASTGLDILSTEAYTALSRWADIINNPARIDKIHQAGLTANSKDKKKKSILQLAEDNDRLGVLKATRAKIAEKLDKGAGSRDTALLTREMTEIMTQIADYERRAGPKKETKVGKLLEDMPEIKPKRPSENGKGARHTSFKSRVSRVTIEDVSQ